MSRRAATWWAVAASAATVAAVVGYLIGLTPALQGPIVVTALFVGPAAAGAAWLHESDAVARWVRATAVAVSVDLLVAEVMLYAHWWHPLALLVLVGTAGAVALIAAAVRGGRRPAGSGRTEAVPGP